MPEMYKSYWGVAWPAAIEGVLLNLMLLADLAMVGRLGIEQAAAVGVVSQPKMILQMFSAAISIAVTAIIARRHGEHDIEGMNSGIKQALLFTFILYSFLVFWGLVFATPIVELAGANSEYRDFAAIYFQYISISAFFKALTAVLSAVQIGVGNTKVVLIAGFAGNIFNVVLNYVFIFGKFGFFEMGISGAGLATVIGNAITFVMLLMSVMNGKNDINILRKGTFKFTIAWLRPMFEVGSNSFMEHLFERTGLFIFSRLIAGLGTVAMGTHHYCIIIWDLYYYFGVGMGQASASFTGRSLGAKRADLAKMYIRVAQRIGLIASLSASVLFLIMRFPMFQFLVSDKEVVSLGTSIVIIIAILIVPQTQAQVTSGVLRGAGDNKFIAVYSLLISAILRPLLAFVFSYGFGMGLGGMWISFLLDELLKMCFAEFRIKQGIWLTKKV